MRGEGSITESSGVETFESIESNDMESSTNLESLPIWVGAMLLGAF